jgi:hypothetical protein
MLREGEENPVANDVGGGAAAAAELEALFRSGRLAHTTLVDGSGVLLENRTLQVYALNETATVVVRALAEGVVDGRELARRLVTAFEVDEATAKADLATYLERLRTMVLG